ncbi:MAG: MucB/RseB C-terminal domain-containing protein [Gammaproteobacteria bacterium]|nr:MucB/RseB C-terminal domain-containing protein [Gammaproteobacteria bacterium]
MRILLSFFFSLSVLLSSLVQADELDVLLKKMMQASKNNNYEGVLVVRHADQLDAMRVQHGKNDKGVWESMESLTGEPRQVIRQQDQVTTIFPQRHLVTVSHNLDASSLHPQLPDNIELLKKFYKLKLMGASRVANRDAETLQLTPKDQYRYGFKFWLDKDTGLLLRCDLLDEKLNVVEQLMFSELSIIDQLPDNALAMDAFKGFKQVDLDEGRQQSLTHQWQAKKLPAGFMLTRMSINTGAQEPVHHLVYSDGMASVSVFIEKHTSDETSLMGDSSMGAVNAYSFHREGNHITAIGEVPVATVRMIGQSVEAVKHD